jgi:hypothetical protein
MWGLKNSSTNDCSKPPLEEKDFAAIPLVPLFTVQGHPDSQQQVWDEMLAQ